MEAVPRPHGLSIALQPHSALILRHLRGLRASRWSRRNRPALQLCSGIVSAGVAPSPDRDHALQRLQVEIESQVSVAMPCLCGFTLSLVILPCFCVVASS